ncbi:hypothetical protein [Phycicoccus flavus]|uniref:hypothetical protein n=1 Tax=Phycicoccus flavus TaxID=2502783 RepID=UPI000FEB6268|nr:hypothetical protein [Phycicoccus flavus]NHA66813.1 hypothetical protein [Phycicoccus flavus]
MTSYRVDAATVLTLGAGLVDLADALTLAGDPSADRWALGPGEVGPAVEDLLGGWRHARLVLAASLAELGEATADAGGLYLDTEAGLSHGLGGGRT